ncbi:MAG: hypothetical protein ACLSH3_01060 [Alistipes finegoldii]
MKKIFAILLSALALGGCENDGIPYVSLGLDDLYKVARMQTVDLKPAFTGESYRWTVKTASGADSLLSEEKDYIFLMQYPGTYDVTFQIFDPVNPIVHRMTFYVVEEEVEYSPYISTVYEYCPAPGQFVNAMPEYREGDTAETMRQKAEEAIAGKMQSGVSLGAYGGYITFGFDHTVVNVPGEYDIRIDGNSFNSAAHPGVDGGSSEPGIIHGDVRRESERQARRQMVRDRQESVVHGRSGRIRIRDHLPPPRPRACPDARRGERQRHDRHDLHRVGGQPRAERLRLQKQVPRPGLLS